MITFFGKASVTLLVFLNSVFPLSAQRDDFETTDFRRADSIAHLYPHHSLRDIRGLAEKLTRSLPTEIEKFRAIYLWVCFNIENDYDLFERNRAKREELMNTEKLKDWNKKINRIVFETLVNRHKTLCTGYAYLIRELALYAGLSCEMINGYGKTAISNFEGHRIPNHSWNAVKLNGKWYLCDATWSSGVVNDQTKSFMRKYNDCYFLPDPRLFVLNHYPVDTAWILLEKKPSLDQFINGPVVYSSLFHFKVDQILPETFTIDTYKGNPVSFSFRRNESEHLSNVRVQVIESDNTYTLSPSLTNSNGVSSFEQTFTTRGTLIVHILMNDAPVYSYEITIR